MNQDVLLQELLAQKALRDLKATVKYAGFSGIVTGCAAFAGGLLAGPFGVAAGATIGGLCAAVAGSGQYKSVPYILLHEATAEQRKKLMQLIMGHVDLKNLATVQEVLATIARNSSLEQFVVQAVIGFLTSEMGRQVLQNKKEEKKQSDAADGQKKKKKVLAKGEGMGGTIGLTEKPMKKCMTVPKEPVCKPIICPPPPACCSTVCCVQRCYPSTPSCCRPW